MYKVMPSWPRPRVFVENLVELAKPGYPWGQKRELPRFCKMCFTYAGGCAAVAKEIEGITGKLAVGTFSFVACCEMGAKTVVIPTGSSWKDPVYAGLGRSPKRDPNHLDLTIRRFKEGGLKTADVPRVRQAWQQLPEFGPAFVRGAIWALRKRLRQHVPQTAVRTLVQLGESYRLYEFDIVIFDTLRKLRNRHVGVVLVRFTSRAEDRGARVVRLVQAPIGGGSVLRVPIIGVGVTGGSLEDPNVAALAAALKSQWERKFNKENPIPLGEVRRWEAKVVVYLKEKLEEHDEWLRGIGRQITVGIDCGSRAVCARLLDELSKLDGLGEGELDDFKEHFRQVLQEHANRLRESLGGQGVELLYVRVLEDIREAMGSVRLDGTSRSRHVTEELLKFLEPYSLGTRIARDRQGVNPQMLLVHDFSGRTGEGDRYAVLRAEQAYEANTSRLRQDLLGLFADCAAAFCKVFTFGIMPTVAVVEKIRLWRYHGHATRRLRE